MRFDKVNPAFRKIALESDNLPSDDEVASSAPEAEFNEGMVETNQELAEGDQFMDGVEQAIEDAEELEEIVDTDLSTEENPDGITMEHARTVLRRANRLCDRLGVAARRMPATEDFGGGRTKREAMEAAGGGLKNALKEAWNWIKEALKKIWDNIVAFWEKLFGQGQRLERAGKSLKEKVSALKDKSKPKDTAIDNAAAYHAFAGENGDFKAAYVGQSLDRCLKLIEGVAKANDILKAGGEEAKKVVEDLNKLNEEAAKAVKEESFWAKFAAKIAAFFESSQSPAKRVDNMVKGLESKLTGVYGLKPMDSSLFGGVSGQAGDFKTHAIGPLVNGKYLTMMSRESIDEATTSFFRVEMKDGSAKRDGKTVTVMAVGEMEVVCTKCETLGKKMVEAKKVMGAAKTFSSTMDKLVDSAISGLGTSDTDSGKTEIKQLGAAYKTMRSVANDLSKAFDTINRTAMGASASAGFSALSYVSACVKNYKESAKD